MYLNRFRIQGFKKKNLSLQSDNFNLFECNLFNKIVKHFFITDPCKLSEKAEETPNHISVTEFQTW